MNTQQLKPQTQVVLNHLINAGSITNVEAHAVHKVRSVSKRISELKSAGYHIGKQYTTDVTGQRYVRYELLDTKLASIKVGDSVIVTQVTSEYDASAKLYSVNAGGRVIGVEGDFAHVRFLTGTFKGKAGEEWFVKLVDLRKAAV
jgi:hypothetical protein